MAVEALVRNLEVQSGDVSLAGSLWMPTTEPAAVVLMHPGSGPSDRDNDVYFPPIREHLLGAGIAVSSFDKRGVGGSTGHWHDAAIAEQADDALACLAALVSDPAVAAPVGLFGHSQGGWVVVEAAGRDAGVAFVVTNAGPGVSPAEQERFATRAHMRRAGIPEDELAAVERYYDDVLGMMRSGASLEEARAQVDAGGFPSAFETLGLPILPDDDGDWKLIAAMVDYDPRPALERIDVPLLALFGAEDPITPVEASVAVYREAVPADLLRIEVFAGAGHRVQTGDPPELADGYLETLAAFILAAVA